MTNYTDNKQKVIDLAQNDPKFLEALKADPKKAIEEHFSQTIPADVNIAVVEDTEKVVFLNVVPPGVPPKDW